MNIPKATEGDMTAVNRAIMREIEHAQTWHDVMQATRALQHARFLYDQMTTEIGREQGRGMAGATVTTIPGHVSIARGLSEAGLG